MSLVFVVPAGLSRPTGGNRYDQALIEALRQLGETVDVWPVPGAWPVGTALDRDRLGRALQSDDPILVDGLLACGAPAEVDDAVAHGSRVHILVHMPLALDTGLAPDVASSRNGLEGQALHAATGALATSSWTASDLGRRHGLSQVTVAPPGVWPAGLAHGSEPPLLLQLAAVAPVKNQLTVVSALARVADVPWSARLVGPLDADPGYADAVREQIERYGLADRIQLTGPLDGVPLEKVWAATDLLLLPSRAETWGMAVTEALARGIPAIVGHGTGAEESLGQVPQPASDPPASPGPPAADAVPGAVPGAVVDANSLDAIADAVRHLLGPGRDRAVSAALHRRVTLASWLDTASIVRKALQ